MLPVGGIGINCAIADAVEAANVLVEPLGAGRLQDAQLSEAQRRRERVTRIVQRFQAAQRKRVIAALESGRPFRVPPLLRVLQRVPRLRNIPARVIGSGVWRVRLEPKPVVVALLKASRTDDHRPFARAAQLLEAMRAFHRPEMVRREDNSRRMSVETAPREIPECPQK
jgi:hypothetical protein